MTTISITRDDGKATAIIKAIGQIDEGLELAPIVRCKDCQEWKELLLNNLPAGVGDCRCNLMTTDAHFYCAYGERRSE